MAWSGFHITKSGRDLLNRCLTTGAFRFVKVVLGDGAYTGSWDDYAPVSPKMTFEGEDMRVYRSGDSTRVEISLTSDGNTTGWYYREYALFATDGSDTVVFACDTCGGDGEYIDPSNPSVLLDDRLCWEFVISADASVNVTYQSSTYVPAQGGESGETVVTFTEAQDASLEDLSSGASLSSLWSIAKKLLADLSDAISQVSPDITAQTQTTITGILKGANGKIAAAIAGTDYLTEETDPTVPAWAKAQTKPAYTAAEVGAASARIAGVTLPSTGWSGDSAPYSQTIAIEGLAENGCVCVVAPTAASREAVSQCGLYVSDTLNESGQLTFFAEEAPSEELALLAMVITGAGDAAPSRVILAGGAGSGGGDYLPLTGGTVNGTITATKVYGAVWN